MAMYAFRRMRARNEAAQKAASLTPTLETVGSWSKVYETKNIGIVRATNVSNQD